MRYSRTCLVLIWCGVLCGLAALFPTAQAQRRHGPPWDAPVASSRVLHIGGSAIHVDFGPGPLDLPPERILAWVENAAGAVSTYYGRFPVPSDRILIVPVSGARGILRGTTWGDVGGFPAFTRIEIGQHTTQQDLDRDWEMTHELVHTAFPTMSDNQHWIEEGLATYIEPVARVQAHLLRPEKIWGDMLRDMQQGDPAPGDQGLDRTHTWGRTYWGGAQFCLLADVSIRRQTGNRKGLQDALRAIVAAGGTIDKNWTLRRALETGDRATGTTVLIDLYDRMGNAPVKIDLQKLWTELGVEAGPGGVHFNDNAPLAAVREAITRAPTPYLP